MIKPFYKVGDILHCVNEFRVVKVRVEEIVISYTGKPKPTITYNVQSLGLEAQGKKKLKATSEAYLVRKFKDAKESALTNWANITRNVNDQLENLVEESYPEPNDIDPVTFCSNNELPKLGTEINKL